MYPIAYLLVMYAAVAIMLLGIFFIAILLTVYEGYVYHRDLEKRLQNRRSAADEYRKKRNRKQ